MSAMSNAIVCHALLVLGIALQFCFGLSMLASVVGTLIVVLGPMFVARMHDWIGNGSVFTHSQWKSVEPAQALEILDSLRNHRFYISNRSLDDNILAILGSVPLRLIGGIAALFFYIRLDPIIACLCIDAAFLPYDLFLVKYGAPPYRIPAKIHALGAIDKEKIDSIKTILENVESRESMRAAVKFQLSSGDDCHRIDEIQVPIYPIRRIPRILASDLCVVLNQLQGSTYPYVHYILALRGLDIGEDRFDDVTEDTSFTLQRREVNGNAVFIVCETKGVDRFNTSNSDIAILLDIVEKMWKRLEKTTITAKIKGME